MDATDRDGTSLSRTDAAARHWRIRSSSRRRWASSSLTCTSRGGLPLPPLSSGLDRVDSRDGGRLVVVPASWPGELLESAAAAAAVSFVPAAAVAEDLPTSGAAPAESSGPGEAAPALDPAAALGLGDADRDRRPCCCCCSPPPPLPAAAPPAEFELAAAPELGLISC